MAPFWYHKTLFSSPDKKMIISATWEQVTLQEAVTITNRSRAISSSMNHLSLRNAKNHRRSALRHDKATPLVLGRCLLEAVLRHFSFALLILHACLEIMLLPAVIPITIVAGAYLPRPKRAWCLSRVFIASCPTSQPHTHPRIMYRVCGSLRSASQPCLPRSLLTCILFKGKDRRTRSRLTWEFFHFTGLTSLG
jgi:hypothetical protein